MVTAFVDESCRARRGEDTAVYVLAAVLVADDVLDGVRAAMEDLRYGKAPTLHWRIERPERRHLIAQTFAGLPVEGVVAVCLHARATRTERARRHCMTRLLSELSARGVDQVVFESRPARQNNADLKLVFGMRRAHQLDPRVRIIHQEAHTDPALWAADAVAGIVTWWLDGTGEYWPLVRHQVTLLDVDEG